MSTATWSALSAESANIAGTAMDSKANGTTSFVADFDNTTGKALYVLFWMTLGSLSPSTTASVTLELRRKRSSTYADNAAEKLTIAVPTGAAAKNIDFPFNITSAGVYGIYWTNSTGVTSAASGNALYYQTFNEDIT